MARAGRGAIPGLALAGLAAGCGALGPAPPEPRGALRLSFEEQAEPSAFVREGVARRDPGGAAGLWAVVPGLPRPERAVVVRLATGAEVTVALFAGGRAGEIRLSAEAADALGIGAEPARVRVTALRRAPRLEVQADAF